MRAISRADMLSHYDGAALARCRAMMVDADLSLAVARGRYFDTPRAKRIAASKLIRSLAFAFQAAERDVDAIAVEIFDMVPFARPAVWDRPAVIDEPDTRRGGG